MEGNIYYVKDDDPKMQEAFTKARSTFKYFWRELSWEFNRIVPALDLAFVKVACHQKKLFKGVQTEFMWISNISFDGITVKGVLNNEPNVLTNIKLGDVVEVPVAEICDWMFSTNRKVYGGFTIQVIRAMMSENDRAAHDSAWGLDFGDPDKVLVAYEQEEKPENLTEHPMSIAMKDGLVQFLQSQPENITSKDADGYTMLHRQAIAGNKACVEVLLQMGADINATTNSGYTASDFAKKLEWEHLISIL